MTYDTNPQTALIGGLFNPHKNFDSAYNTADGFAVNYSSTSIPCISRKKNILIRHQVEHLQDLMPQKEGKA